ncbi:MAG: division/cell wall cluster transcriptional repressor MraZ [Lachnospiraceae bacterium]|nr:division/cell wall cluster transcriptional repressor MraZ [Lachnospiraceae bacterium]
MYMGEYSHSIDAKGRTTVPAKLREALGEGFVVTKGLDRCLWMLDAERWEKIEQMVQELPMTLKEARVFARFMIGGACEGEMDKQGRLLLPANLREYAGLTKDVIFVGTGGRVEIWDKDSFYSQEAEDDITAVTMALEGKGYRF